MSSLRERYKRALGSGDGTDRLEFFSDAVFAIAMTLLVIDLRVPDLPEDEHLSAASIIVDQFPGFLAYALSFAIIGLNWASHHRKFRVIERFDGRLVQLSFVLLFLVTFVPFPTALIAETPAEFSSVALYAFVVGALSMVQLAIWMYARHAGLMSGRVDVELYRYVCTMLFPVPIVFWGSILIAIWNPFAAMVSWVLLIPVNIALRVLGSRVAQRRLVSTESPGPS